MLPPRGPVNGDWLSLLADYPERFVLGSDSFVVADRFSGPQAPRIFAQRTAAQRQGIRRLLDLLPPELARKIGHENAQRLYRLNSK